MLLDMVDIGFCDHCDILVGRDVDKEDVLNHIIVVSFPVTTTVTLENTNERTNTVSNYVFNKCIIFTCKYMEYEN